MAQRATGCKRGGAVIPGVPGDFDSEELRMIAQKIKETTSGEFLGFKGLGFRV